MTFEMGIMWFGGAGIVGGVVMWMSERMFDAPTKTPFPYLLFAQGALWTFIGVSL